MMDVSNHTISITSIVISFVIVVLDEAQSKKIRKFPLELSDNSISLFFFTNCEFVEGRCNVDPILSHHVVALTTLCELFFILFCQQHFIEELLEVFIWLFYR